MERYEWAGYTGKECEVVWGDEDRPVGVIANDVDMVHELLRLAARVKELEGWLDTISSGQSGEGLCSEPTKTKEQSVEPCKKSGGEG